MGKTIKASSSVMRCALFVGACIVGVLLFALVMHIVDPQTGGLKNIEKP